MRSRISLVIISIAILTMTTFAQSDRVKLKGQVVCSICWFESDDRKKVPYGTLADIKCAKECSDDNETQSLAVETEKGFTLYKLEKGSIQLEDKDFLKFVPKTVEIDGVLRSEAGKPVVRVNSLTVLKETAKPKPLPTEAPLALKDLTGADQSLAALKGRVVVLNFWATWCVPCQKEMPDLSAIQNDYAALGVQVIGAAGDAASDSAKVMKFIRDFKVNFPVWVGAATTDMERFGVGSVLPATVIIDREGKIVWREIGVIKPVELRKELDKILLPKVAEATKVAKTIEKKTKNTSLVPA